VNGFIRFLHEPSFKTSAARELMTVMETASYGHVLFALQIVCGLLLLARIFVPIALTILAGYLFNIYMFHLLLDSAFSPLALVATVLWALTFMRNREAFRMILNARLDGNSQ
jgi:putative oxidoreductase